MNVETLIDQAQSFLHDDGALFSRAELLRWVNDGYRDMVAASRACVRPYQMDMPGRTAWSCAFPWEDRHAPGTQRFFTKATRSAVPMHATYRWEVEAIDNVEPTNSLDCVTQLWEQEYSDDIDAHFRFPLPESNERPLKVYWDSKRLAHTSSRELDLGENEWWREGGEPVAWLPGLGRERSFEVFEVRTTYGQGWDMRNLEQGTPRQFSSDASRTYEADSRTNTWDYAYTTSADVEGDLLVDGLGFRITSELSDGSFATFAWEADTTEETDADDGLTVVSHDFEDGMEALADIELGVGLLRRVRSPDRQYLAAAYDSGQDQRGIARRFATGDDALTVWHAILPTRQLIEGDTPDLLPAQLHKYLKFYVLSKAFGRVGEGYRPDLAQHFAALYQLGGGLMATLGTPSVRDRVYAREQTTDASVRTPPRVQFPSTFQRNF